MSTPGATTSSPAPVVEKVATLSFSSVAPTVKTCGHDAGNVVGLPLSPELPDAATTRQPAPTALRIAPSSCGSGSVLPKLRLITAGQCVAAASRSTIAVKSVMPRRSGLASQTCSAADGDTPTMPAPFTGAAATDATAVPWYSSRPKVDWSFSKVVFGRPANSGCVGSVPLSMIVTGTPGPGAVSPVIPMWASHHCCAWSGSSKARAEAAAALTAAASRSAKSRRSRRPKGHGRVAANGTGSYRARLEPRRPGGDDPGGARRPRGRARRPGGGRLLADRDRSGRGP